MTELTGRLREGATLFGTMVSEVRNPTFMHILARAGLDFVVIDNEHGAYTYDAIGELATVAQLRGISAVVRIPEIRRESICKSLDMGAAGILVPQVRGPKQVEDVVRYAKYPPRGTRGAAMMRSHTLFKKVDVARYLSAANEETAVIVQAETKEAVDDIESIVNVPGLDAVYIGPGDLSVALGHPGDAGHPEVIAAIERVLGVCLEHGVPCGMYIVGLEPLRRWQEAGMRLLSYSCEVQALLEYFGEAKSVAGV